VPESASLGNTLLEAFVTPDRPAQLGLDDVRVGADYDLARGDERRRIAEFKRFRRIPLGETLSLVFENRDTIRSTLEEALRTERIDDPNRVAGEIAAFNALVPEPGQLAAMLFLEVADPADLAAAVAQLEGVEDTVFIEVGGTRVRGLPEVVSPPGESIPAHYLRFSLQPEQRDAILDGAGVAVGTQHPNLGVSVRLDEDQRRALAGDL
jgi:hypothetical protein